MNPQTAVPDSVYTLWAVTLVFGYLLLPAAVYWLHSLWRSARSIRQYTRESAGAAESIARSTGAIPALDSTIATATEVLAAADRVAAKLDVMAGALEARTGGR